MPTPSKGARLYKRGSVFYIRDGGRFLSTRTGERREAEDALARYIATKDRPVGPRDPAQVTVADALDIYANERAPHVKDSARIADCIRALVPILGPLPLSAITGEVCRRYGTARDRAPGTIRKELGTLRAAIRHCHVEGYITSAPGVRLPAKPAPRDRWLTRDEAAKLVRAAYRNPKAKHLARFILVALYSGTRSDVILRMGFEKNMVGGHVDTEAGIMHRRAPHEVETKKRTPTVPVRPRLLAHLRRWERMGARWVVEVDGQLVASLKTAWRTALREAGIEHCTKHDLRHTCATWLMQDGADRWEVAGFMGMSSEMLESVYGHHHHGHMSSVLKRSAEARVKLCSAQLQPK